MGNSICVKTWMSTTFDELQLRHQRGFLHCLTIPLSLRYTCTTTLSRSSMMPYQDREEHCEYLSLLHNRNVHHSVEELLELVAEDCRDAHNEEEEPSGASSSSSFSSSSSSQWTKRKSRTRPHARRQREARRHGPWREAVRPLPPPSSASPPPPPPRPSSSRWRA